MAEVEKENQAKVQEDDSQLDDLIASLEEDYADAAEEEENKEDETFYSCTSRNRTVNETFFSCKGDDDQLDKTLQSQDSFDSTFEEETNKTAIETESPVVIKRAPLACPSRYKAPEKPQQSVLAFAKEKSQKTIGTPFDSFFNIKIRNPKVSSIAFDTLTGGLKKIKCSMLKQGETDQFVTMGVIVKKSEVRKSVNGKEYVKWQIHDLRNCQDKGVDVLLFGECCKEFWKLQCANVVALVTPEMSDPAQNPNPHQKGPSPICLKVFKRAQMMDLGFCPSFGICKGVKADTQPCSNFVNTDLSDVCVYHVMNEARKLSSKRGVFSSISGAPLGKPKAVKKAENPGLYVRQCTKNPLPAASTALNQSGTMRAAPGMAIVASLSSAVTKDEEKASLSKLISENCHLPGAKNLLKMQEARNGATVENKKTANFNSMSAFIQDKTETAAKEILQRTPKLGAGLAPGREISFSSPPANKRCVDDAAKKRAIAILKKKREEAAAGNSGKGLKRKTDNDNNASGTPSKLGKLDAKGIADVLKMKSRFDNQAEAEENKLIDKYLNTMEQKEKVETFVTGIMSVKDVRVVTCKKCNYTAQKQSELCMRNGHAVTRTTAEKRFFKCKHCQCRTTSFGLLPTKGCNQCNHNEWERVSMRDERKVVLENEKLKVRGDEEKFVNR